MPRVSAGDLAYVRAVEGWHPDPHLVGRVVRVQARVCLGDAVRVLGSSSQPLTVDRIPDGIVSWWVTAPNGGALDVTLIHAGTGAERMGQCDRVAMTDSELVRIAGPGLELPADPVAAPAPAEAA